MSPAKSTTAKKPKWKKQHVERGMNMMNMAVHLITLKDNYRRDLHGFEQAVKREKETDDFASVMSFLDSMEGYSSKDFKHQCLEAAEILETLGGPVKEEEAD